MKKGPAALSILHMALIWALSSRPLHFVPLPGPTDKLAHFAAFVPLGYLLRRALGPGLWWAALLAAAAYGVVDEFHQSFVPGRVPSALDALADAAGSAAGVLVAMKRAGTGLRPS